MAIPRRTLARAETKPRRDQQPDEQAIDDIAREDRADGVHDGAEERANGLEEAPALLGRVFGGALGVAGRVGRERRLALAAALLTPGGRAVERAGARAGRDGGFEAREEIFAVLGLAFVCAAFDGTWEYQ